MTYINFITGLIIAAVLSVPGAMQHEATQVGEELVVKSKTETLKVQDERWFLVDVSSASDPSNPSTSEQMIQSGYDEDISTPCPGSQLICAVRLSYDSSNTSVTNLLNQIETSPNTVSVADFDGLPANVLLYAHKNP